MSPPGVTPRFYVAHIRPGAVITALHLARACNAVFNAVNCMTPVTIELPEEEETLRIMADLIQEANLVGHLSSYDAAR